MYDNGIAWMIGHGSPTDEELAGAMRERQQRRILLEARQRHELGEARWIAGPAMRRAAGRISAAAGRIAAVAGRQPAGADAACCTA
jgi:hypothetical protein